MKEKRAGWFKLWLHHLPLILALPDAVVGRAFKALLLYFSTGEDQELGELESILFATIKPDVDEAIDDYLRRVENGKAGGRPKNLDKQKPWVSSGNLLQPMPTEVEGEVEGEGEKEGAGIMADKPPAHPRFVPPTVEDVAHYCQEHGYSVVPERFCDYYQSNGWMVGKYKMRDWQAAVRNWSREEKKDNGQMESQHVWPELGTVI